MKKYLFVIPLMALLSSCIGLTNISTPQTVALSEGNFKFVKTVSAEVKVLYIFGIGGIKEEANEDVVEKLRVEANLQPNQALADIRIKTTKKTYFGIVTKRTLTAAASVVEFRDTNTNTFLSTENIIDVKESQVEQKQKVIKEDKKQTVVPGTVVSKKNSNETQMGLPKQKKSTVEPKPELKKEPKKESNLIHKRDLNTDTQQELSKENVRESAYQQLLEIKKSLDGASEQEKEDISNKVKRIEKWYSNIGPTYPEIETLLKEIKKLL